MATDIPYNYKRSRTRDERMADSGRAPSYGRTKSGEMFLRGFRSTPGASISPRNNFDATTGFRRDPNTGFTNDSDWGNFFKGNSPTGVRLGYTATNPAIEAAAFQPISDMANNPPVTPSGVAPISDNPVPSMPSNGPGNMLTSDAPTTDSYLGSVISNAQNWMKRFGTDLYG